MARADIDPATGFILLSARCSYELVEKTVRAACPMLVTISAPTSLPAERAADAGLTHIPLARPASALIVRAPHGILACIHSSQRSPALAPPATERTRLSRCTSAGPFSPTPNQP